MTIEPSDEDLEAALLIFSVTVAPAMISGTERFYVYQNNVALSGLPLRDDRNGRLSKRQCMLDALNHLGAI